MNDLEFTHVAALLWGAVSGYLVGWGLEARKVYKKQREADYWREKWIEKKMEEEKTNGNGGSVVAHRLKGDDKEAHEQRT